MRTDGAAADLDRLRTVLATLGTDPSPLELAEILWLAAHRTPQVPAAARPDEPPRPEAPEPGPPATPRPDQPPATRRDEGGHAPNPPARKEVHAAGADPGEGAATPDVDALVREVMVPTAPMLTGTLAIQRALRPLKRRVPSRRTRVLDERATADRLARDPDRTGPWLPVMAPATERWLSMVLLVETGPSMRMWRSLGRELHQTLARTGAFRDVRVMYLNGALVGASPRGPFRDCATLVDPSGTQATLVLSDCTGAHWWTGQAQRALHVLAQRGPLAVVQPLPERLWGRTACPATHGRLAASRPCASNAALGFTSYDGDPGPGAPWVQVPLLRCRPGWLGDWAELVLGTGTPREAAVTWFGTEVVPPAPLVRERRLPIEAQVRRFQATASPEAVKLAANVAVSSPVLPVMRLIQRHLVTGSTSDDLAEMLLSGLLRPRENDPLVYDFVEGAQEELLTLLPRSEAFHTAQVLEGLSQAIERQAGQAAEMFRGAVRSRDGTGTAADTKPFALVSDVALRVIHRTGSAGGRPRTGGAAGRTLAGRYRLLNVRTEAGSVRTWHGLDGTTEVLVKEIEIPGDPSARARLHERLTECVDKSARLGEGVVHYLDFFAEQGRWWLIKRHRPGTPLESVLRARGLMPWRTAANLGRQLLQTLTDCAELEFVHGSISITNILVDETGAVTLVGFEDEALGLAESWPFDDPSRALFQAPSAAGDLWGAARALHRAVAGRPFSPFAAPDTMDRLFLAAGPLRIPLRQMLRPEPRLRMSLPLALRIFTALDATGEPPEATGEAWITMWGPPASGKTTFLGALALAIARSEASWLLLGTDMASTNALTHTTSLIATQRRFPAPTTSIDGHRWKLVGTARGTSRVLRRRRAPQPVEIGLNVFDPPGELLLTDGLEGPDGADDRFESLARSKGIIYLFDPIRENEEGDAFEYLNNMLSQLSVRLRGADDFLPDGRLPHHVAVCVTKFDDLRVYQTAERLNLLSLDPDDQYGFPRVLREDAKELFLRLCDVYGGNSPLVPGLINQFFHPERIGYFVTSAIGFYLDGARGYFDPDDTVNVLPGTPEDADVRVRGQVHPINVMEPLLWLGGRVAGRASR